MSNDVEAFGRTVQLFLVDGTPNGLMIASIHGWTGSVLVANNATFARLVARPETDRAGIYILHGPDPDRQLGSRAYIGEADNVRERVVQSGKQRAFWESALVVTTSDDALNKAHVRYLEARLIELARASGRATLDNGNDPPSDRRRLSEADRANMEAFLANLKVILPVVGLDLLKPSVGTRRQEPGSAPAPQFEMRHKSGVKALAMEQEGEFVVVAGSEALKDAGFVGTSYSELKRELIADGVLVVNGERYRFTRAFAFRSPSAAAAVVLDRSSNGRLEWKVVGSSATYDEWQQQKARADAEHA
jgi:hypothetical protein